MQASGQRRDLTARCDIYALGVILSELLVGHPPFAADDDAELLRRVREEEPPRPRGHRRDVPRDLEAIALRCLEKEPDRRHHDRLSIGITATSYLAIVLRGGVSEVPGMSRNQPLVALR